MHTPLKNSVLPIVALCAPVLFYCAPASAYIQAIELPPVAAVELPPPNVQPIAAIELAPPALTPVMAKELPAFDDREVQVASVAPVPAEVKPAPVRQALAQTAHDEEPAPTWTPVAHNSALTAADYNPAVY